jgi:hypothetical protein
LPSLAQQDGVSSPGLLGACASGNLSEVDRLIEAKADVNEKDKASFPCSSEAAGWVV